MGVGANVWLCCALGVYLARHLWLPNPWFGPCAWLVLGLPMDLCRAFLDRVFILNGRLSWPHLYSVKQLLRERETDRELLSFSIGGSMLETVKPQLPQFGAAGANMPITTSTTTTTGSSRLYILRKRQVCFLVFPLHCSSDSKPRPGFGRQPTTHKKDKKVTANPSIYLT
ncbi:hypothetical protein U1Q18_046716 [Sarracenia purpurea var. burkii]